MIKAAFFDIDGTLVGFNHKEISDRNMAALDALRRRGVKVFVASGRHPLLIHNLRDCVFDGYITMNGSYAYIGNEMISSTPMDHDDAVTIARISVENNIPCVVFFADRMGINVENEVTAMVNAQIHVPSFKHIDLLKEVTGSTTYQFSLYITDEVQKALYEPYANHVIWPRWHPAMIDVVPDNSTKWKAIQDIMARLGLKREEVAAFGDGGNDIEMIRGAGLGIAMANSGPDVKAAADYLAPDADEDGVAQALKNLGLI